MSRGTTKKSSNNLYYFSPPQSTYFFSEVVAFIDSEDALDEVVVDQLVDVSVIFALIDVINHHLTDVHEHADSLCSILEGGQRRLTIP